jgi:BlaR1 peptidase M56
VSRDLVVASLVLVFLAVGVALAGWIPPAGRAASGSSQSGWDLERSRWRSLWAPALVPAIAIATTFGWRLQEPPVTDEPLTRVVLLFVIPAAVIAVRALWRAFLACRRPLVPPPIATMGLLRPRIVVSTKLDSVLDPAAMDAAMAHERAHARHFDPLRIWIAQMVTDLQWPSPFARRRLDAWLSALEIARDEEARRGGALGEDLAAAVVAVARMHVFSTGAAAGLTGTEAALAARVHRLLAPLPTASWRRALLLPTCVSLAIAMGVLFGATHGDSFVRALPFIGG